VLSPEERPMLVFLVNGFEYFVDDKYLCTKRFCTIVLPLNYFSYSISSSRGTFSHDNDELG
jgi:hypothetical protein